ncbi:MAG: hypothetical protein P9M07_01415 [Candidatus Aceula meridiana]|nr:hypothetical protein [Candidatus Aceula meridiana]
MDEKQQKRLKLLNHLSEELKKVEKEQQVTIEHLAKVQIEVQETGKEVLSQKIGEIFSNATRNTELLHEMLHEFTIEINQLKQGA